MRSWYRSRRWAELRAEILERDEYTCQHCGEWGNEVDHIVPRWRNKDLFWVESNLQLLCRDCHIDKSRRENPEMTPGRLEWIALVDNREVKHA